MTGKNPYTRIQFVTFAKNCNISLHQVADRTSHPLLSTPNAIIEPMWVIQGVLALLLKKLRAFLYVSYYLANGTHTHG